jgi:hypothetical protein
MNSSLPKITLLRSALITAILATLLATGVSIVRIRQKIIVLQTSLKRETVARQAAEIGWAQTKADLSRRAASLDQTKIALTSANAAKEKLAADLGAERKRAEVLANGLAQTTQERNDALAELARFKEPGFTPEQLLGIARELNNLRDALAEERLKNQMAALRIEELIKVLPADEPVPLPAGLRTRVSVTDPKWRFVVLDAGKDQGVLRQGELLISRNGKLVGKVRVSRVEKDRSIANMVPGWEFGEVMEGDLVLPAFPRS